MNNEVEYEAMILVILFLKELQVKRVVLHGGSELIIKQMTGEHQARHPRMRSYQNVAKDIIEFFEECNFSLIPRVQNCVANSLATSMAAFKFLMNPVGKYEIEVRHRTSVLDNLKI